jgi:hypothetical protein
MTSLIITSIIALAFGLGLYAFGIYLYKLADKKDKLEKELKETFS